MTHEPREPRYGEHTYEVRVSTQVTPSGVLYLMGDSITVSGGALMLAVEVDPLEEIDEPQPLRPRGNIELPPTTVIAPGQWFSVRMVDAELRPMFVSGSE